MTFLHSILVHLSEEQRLLISRILSSCFLFLLLYNCRKMLRRWDKKPLKPSGVLKGYVRIVHGLGLFLFLGILVAQAYWQLAGFMNANLMTAIRKYDKREPNYFTAYHRGSILDRHGVVLAESKLQKGVMVRYYPKGSAACQIIGYDNLKFGRSGIENFRDNYLMGRSFGSLPEIVTAINNLFMHSRLRGNDLVTSLDGRLQETAFNLLGEYQGAIVLFEVVSGDLLACASSPGFDPNQLDDLLFTSTANGSPLLNRALQGAYPPGSTFKIVVTAAALEAGVAPQFTCTAEGYAPSDKQRKIRDHDFYEAIEQSSAWAGHGSIDLTKAFTLSCNVYFAQLGYSLGYEAIYRKAHDFGMDVAFEIAPSAWRNEKMSCPAGELPKPSEVNEDNILSLAIGQGPITTSPLHMAVVAATIAHSGQLTIPHIFPRPQAPADLPAALSVSVAERLQRMMTAVVVSGTGRVAKTSAFSVAGKTGTAENPGGPGHAWFVGFAPAQTPTVAFAVLLENAGYAAKSAVPVARKLLEKANELGYLQPHSAAAQP